MDKLLKEYINSILSLREGIGQKSLTHGINCTASGIASFASGIGLNAVKDGQTVVGSYNTTDITSFFVVGAGETSVSSANAFAAGRNLTASTIYINQSPIPSKNSYIQIGAVTISEDRAATLNQIEAIYESKLPPTPSNPAQKVLSGNRTWVEMSGSGTGDKTYVYNQVVASDTWVINHSLGKYPSVTVVDSGGTTVVGRVTYQSFSTCTVEFGSAFSGRAFLN